MQTHTKNLHVDFREELGRNIFYYDQSYSRADTERRLEVTNQDMKMAINHKCEYCDKKFHQFTTKGAYEEPQWR